MKEVITAFGGLQWHSNLTKLFDSLLVGLEVENGHRHKRRWKASGLSQYFKKTETCVYMVSQIRDIRTGKIL
jgi:hypothetical protein